jgi:hypothetical protein
MSEARDNGPGVAVTINAGEASPGEREAGGEDQGGAEISASPEAAVQIAEIEAGRDIALAEIRNEGDAAFAEQLSNSELEQCRLRIAELEGLNQGLAETVATLELTVASLTPPPSEPPPNPPEPPPSPDAVGDASEPVESPPPDEPPPPRKRLIRWT